MSNVEINQAQIQHSLDFCEEVVSSCHPRLPGSEGCKKAAGIIEKEYSKNCDPDSVVIEEFDFHPKAFLKWITPAIIFIYFGLIPMIFNIVLPAIIIIIIADIMTFSQFVFYNGYFDFLFKKETGYNIYGTIEPEEEVKQQIIVSGHHDAAYVFNLMDKHPILHVVAIAGIFLHLILVTIFSIGSGILTLINGPALFINVNIIFYMIISLIYTVPMSLFTTSKVSPGAGDNMIATAVVNEVAKIFTDAKNSGNNLLKNTRIIALTFDGEEAGTRGARAYARKHKEELNNIKTYAFNMDGLYSLGTIIFLKSDLNMTVKLSKEMADECAQVARDLGYKSKVFPFPFGAGSTDAAQLAKVAKIETTTLFGMSVEGSSLDKVTYHTPRDVTSCISPDIVEASIKIAKEYLLKKDREIQG
ncbi:MAG: Zn-dependent exopeptidase M28 [archaeon]|nr:Zn-dependent exopeptidase M28 [archaeon]